MGRSRRRRVLDGAVSEVDGCLTGRSRLQTGQSHSRSMLDGEALQARRGVLNQSGCLTRRHSKLDGAFSTRRLIRRGVLRYTRMLGGEVFRARRGGHQTLGRTQMGRSHLWTGQFHSGRSCYQARRYLGRSQSWADTPPAGTPYQAGRCFASTASTHSEGNLTYTGGLRRASPRQVGLPIEGQLGGRDRLPHLPS